MRRIHRAERRVRNLLKRNRGHPNRDSNAHRFPSPRHSPTGCGIGVPNWRGFGPDGYAGRPGAVQMHAGEILIRPGPRMYEVPHSRAGDWLTPSAESCRGRDCDRQKMVALPACNKRRRSMVRAQNERGGGGVLFRSIGGRGTSHSGRSPPTHPRHAGNRDLV
jgi:hypothetical protein